jgi:hypothetical protein
MAKRKAERKRGMICCVSVRSVLFYGLNLPTAQSISRYGSELTLTTCSHPACLHGRSWLAVVSGAGGDASCILTPPLLRVTAGCIQPIITKHHMERHSDAVAASQALLHVRLQTLSYIAFSGRQDRTRGRQHRWGLCSSRTTARSLTMSIYAAGC